MYTSGFGQTVNGYYGINQWEYLLTNVTEEEENFAFPITRVYELEEQPTAEELEEMRNHPNMYAETEAQYAEMYAAWAQLSLDHLTNYNMYDVENDPDRAARALME